MNGDIAPLSDIPRILTTKGNAPAILNGHHRNRDQLVSLQSGDGP